MKQDPDFEGQRALITGGTKGIGKAAAVRLARRGAHVVLNYSTDTGAANAALAEFSGAGYSAELARADLGKPEEVGAMLDHVLGNGRLDILLCNAAFQEKVPFLETEYAVLQRAVEVNILGNFHLIQTVGKDMIAKGVPGRIVVCTSPHGRLVYPDAFAYDVTKAALNHLIRCTALPLIKHGIRVNGVDIGWTVTPGERRWTTEDEQHRVAREIVPIQRPAQADEIAAVIEFLCGEQSSYMVGSLVLADGGYCLAPSSGS